MPQKFQLSEMEERLKFDVRLQISLRSNAVNIMKHYDDKEKFEKYVSERESKIRKLLGCTENPLIFDGEKQLFP